MRGYDGRRTGDDGGHKLPFFDTGSAMEQNPNQYGKSIKNIFDELRKDYHVNPVMSDLVIGGGLLFIFILGIYLNCDGCVGICGEPTLDQRENEETPSNPTSSPLHIVEDVKHVEI